MYGICYEICLADKRLCIGQIEIPYIWEITMFIKSWFVCSNLICKCSYLDDITACRDGSRNEPSESQVKRMTSVKSLST